LGLFEESHSRITCIKMAKRLDQSMTSSSKMRKLITAAKVNHDAIMISHDPIMESHARLDKTRLENTRGRGKRTPAKVEHETLGVPIGQTRYTTLCTEHGAETVDRYIQAVKDWADEKGKRVLDYAAAAGRWIAKDVADGKLKASGGMSDEEFESWLERV